MQIEGEALSQSEIERIRDATLWVHDETVKGMNAGKSLHALLAEIRLPAQLEVGEGYGMVRWSVQAIWEHYAGWFHHESTTELYAVPRRAIHGDLVELAGGAAALVDRAREKLAAGQHEQAIHLLDIVLSEPAPPPAAFEVAIAVHRALAKESVNFWLSAWLNEQVERLEARAVEIKIIDEGSGIAPENLERIFDPFFTTKRQGTGLGLAFSHKIISAHRGSIAISSAPGQGSQFTISLPAVEGR